MEDYLATYGPYERCYFYGDILGSNVVRVLDNARARTYKEIQMLYGQTTLGLKPKNKDEPIKAIFLSYIGKDEKEEDSKSLDILHVQSNVGDVTLLEDGTIAYFYSGNTPLSYTGFIHPPERKVKDKIPGSSVPYPNNPTMSIAKFIRIGMLDFLLNSGQKYFVVDYFHGQRKILPPKTATTLATGDTAKRVIKMGAEEFVDYTIDTPAFRALTELVALSIDTYKAYRKTIN